MAFEMRHDLVLRFGEEAEIPAVSEQARQRAQREGACVPNRVEQALAPAQLRDALLGPCEMLGFLLRRPLERRFRLRVTRGQRLALIESLRTDLAHVVDAHECGG